MVIYRVETEWGSVAWFCSEEAAFSSATGLCSHGWVRVYEEKFFAHEERLVVEMASVFGKAA